MPIDQLQSLVLSRFGLDGGAMFGIVPKPIWERSNPADPRNRIRMTGRALLLDIGDRRVLVETGMGDKWGAKEADIFAVDTSFGSAPARLRALGIDSDTITDIIITHLHFDHAGGLTIADGDGPPRPAFPRATHWVQGRNLAYAESPGLREVGSYRRENFAWMRDPGGVRVELLDGPQRLFDAIDLIPTNGHTRGMQLLRFDHAGDTFLHAADIVPTYGHTPVAYVMGYDMEPMTSIEEKRTVLAEVAQGGFLSTGHDPDHGFARIAARGHDKFEAYDKVDGGAAT